MIRVQQQAEPQNFEADVRQPGAAFLAKNPRPTSKEFGKPNNFWKKIAGDLYDAYSGVCSYSGFYIPLRGGTVDHFLPKSTFPELAYEWSNYRLASFRMNLHKGDSADVMDPFTVQTGWFIIDFPSCLVRPADDLTGITLEQVARTIEVLKLNDDDDLVQERCNIMLDFVDGDVTLRHLQRRYPFIAAEIERQGLDQESAKLVFKRRE